MIPRGHLMVRVTSFAFVVFVSQVAAAAEPTAAAKQYHALLAEYEDEGGARLFSKRFLRLAEQHPQDPAAVDALLWVVAEVRGRADTTRALELLKQHLGNSSKLGAAAKDIASSRSVAAEALLRAVVEKSPHQKAQAHACYYLAELLDLEGSLVAQLEENPELAPRVLEYYGEEYGKHLSSLKSTVLTKEREKVYSQILDSFASVELQGATLGPIAKKRLFQIRHLSVGKVAPEIKGEDIRGKEFKLSDHRGKVVMLSFWGHW